MARKLEVVITGDAASLERTFRRAGRSASGFERGLRSASIGAGVALGAMGLAAKAGFAEFMEGDRVSAQTAAALKSTGGAAKTVQGDIESLAGSLSRLSGVDDEVIQSGQNMLLTFTRIRNEVGKGNDIFDQATKATLNLSVAMGKDMPSAALLVGKALNDPIGGMSALTRAGVQFTDQQKETIQSLIESGNRMGAQKIILKELETQFGGSAKAAGQTFSGQLNVAKNSLAEMGAQIVAGAVPTLKTLSATVVAATGFMRQHETGTKIVIGTLAALAVGVLAVNVAMKTYAATMVVARAAQLALNLAMTMNPIGVVIVALTALGVALVVAYKKSETFRDVVHAAFSHAKLAVALLLGPLGLIVYNLDRIRSAAHAAAAAIRSIPTPNLRIPFTGGGPSSDEIFKIGGRAAGGPVAARTPYMVGERGPELFVPGRSGTIVPNGRGGGLGTQVIQLVVDGKTLAEIVRSQNASYARANG